MHIAQVDIKSLYLHYSYDKSTLPQCCVRMTKKMPASLFIALMQLDGTKGISAPQIPSNSGNPT